MSSSGKWITQCIGNHPGIEEIQRLPAATSSSVYRLLLRQGNTELSLILRLFTSREWPEEEPDLEKHEVESLQLAESIPVATPELITYDEKGESCGYPTVSMTECQGTIDLHPSNFSHWITEMAHTLYQIHSIPVSTFEWTYFPYHDIKNLQTPAWFSYKKSGKR